MRRLKRFIRKKFVKIILKKMFVMIACLGLLTSVSGFPVGAADGYYEELFGKNVKAVYTPNSVITYPNMSEGVYGFNISTTTTKVDMYCNDNSIGFNFIAGRKYTVELEIYITTNGSSSSTRINTVNFYPFVGYEAITRKINHNSNTDESTKFIFDFTPANNNSYLDYYIIIDFPTTTSFRRVRFGKIKIYEDGKLPTKDDKDKDSLRSRENVESRGKDADEASAQTESAKNAINSQMKEIQESSGYTGLISIFGNIIGLFGGVIGIIGVTFLMVILVKKGMS